MSKPVVEVQVRAVAATSGGCAVFLGNEQKVFLILVDRSVGVAITMFIQGTQRERPLTHDLIANILRALGTKIERVIVNRCAAQRLHRAGGSTMRTDLCKS
jgi:uncharacterized protein